MLSISKCVIVALTFNYCCFSLVFVFVFVLFLFYEQLIEIVVERLASRVSRLASRTASVSHKVYMYVQYARKYMLTHVLTCSSLNGNEQLQTPHLIVFIQKQVANNGRQITEEQLNSKLNKT